MTFHDISMRIFVEQLVSSLKTAATGVHWKQCIELEDVSVEPSLVGLPVEFDRVLKHVSAKHKARGEGGRWIRVGGIATDHCVP